MKERNSPPQIHRGKTYQECLELLVQRLEEYEGEPIPPSIGKKEHPLHYAVRLVESWHPSRYKMFRWRRLPPEALKLWGEILISSRSGVTEFMTRAGHVRNTRNYGDADPKAAKQAAVKLKRWVKKQLSLKIERPIES